MSEKEYSVSEAVRLVGVESHVLRYWEEELQVEIRRTAQGHRVYSAGNIETFCRVKELKERGLQLRAIRVLLDEAEGDMAKASLAEQICEIGARAGKEEERTAPPPNRTASGDESECLRDRPESDNAGECFRDRSAAEAPDGEPEGRESSELEEPELEEIPESSEEELFNGDPEEQYEVCRPLRTMLSETETENPDRMGQFEDILKALICEVMEEQNRKQEQMLRQALREEIRGMHFVWDEALQEAVREAAAARESQEEKKGLLDILRRLLRKRRTGFSREN